VDVSCASSASSYAFHDTRPDSPDIDISNDDLRHCKLVPSPVVDSDGGESVDVSCASSTSSYSFHDTGLDSPDINIFSKDLSRCKLATSPVVSDGEVSANLALQNTRASLSSESTNFNLETTSGTVSFGDNISTHALAESLCTR
jgi:hypothetical protein